MLKIRVPATSANLGPGFDCLGLALDLWNEISFEPADEITYHVTGEGADKLDNRPHNLLTNSFAQVYEVCGKKMTGIKITAHNHILLSSGLGSSAAAIVAGLYGANELLGKPLGGDALLNLATKAEGHPDNVAPALRGGLVISAMNADEIITRRYEMPSLTMVIVKPDMHWPTTVARSVLPKSVSRTDAIFNIGRTALVVDALRNGDLDLLQKVMDDRLHQPYRMSHIPGCENAWKAARKFGAAALSGAGPSIIAFVPPEAKAQARAAMLDAFKHIGVEACSLFSHPSSAGVHVF